MPNNRFSRADLAYDALGALSGAFTAYWINDTFFSESRYRVTTEVGEKKKMLDVHYRF